MKHRYIRAWSLGGIGRAITQVIGWDHAVPRVGGLFPGYATSIPAPLPVTPTMAECIEHHAQELANLGRPLCVLWSGGLDSTTALVALLKAERTQQVAYTVNSQALRSATPETLAAVDALGAVRTEYSFANIEKLRREGWLFVTGTHADSITLGEVADANHIHDSVWDMPLERVLGLHSRNRMTPKAMAAFWEQLEPLLALMPLERTVPNMIWWLDFTCCWSRDEYDMVFRLDMAGGPGTDYVNFFGTESFQRWAMQDTRQKAAGKDAKGQIRAWVNSSLGLDTRCQKNLMAHDLVSQTYQNVLFSDRLLAVNYRFKPILAAS